MFTKEETAVGKIARGILLLLGDTESRHISIFQKHPNKSYLQVAEPPILETLSNEDLQALITLDNSIINRLESSEQRFKIDNLLPRLSQSKPEFMDDQVLNTNSNLKEHIVPYCKLILRQDIARFYLCLQNYQQVAQNFSIAAELAEPLISDLPHLVTVIVTNLYNCYHAYDRLQPRPEDLITNCLNSLDYYLSLPEFAMERIPNKEQVQFLQGRLSSLGQGVNTTGGNAAISRMFSPPINSDTVATASFQSK